VTPTIKIKNKRPYERAAKKMGITVEQFCEEIMDVAVTPEGQWFLDTVKASLELKQMEVA
jgi:hypothetical protein